MVDLTIECAKSARSACKSCKAKIPQGEARIGETRSVGGYDQTSWFHIGCFAQTKSAQSQDIVDIDGYTALTKAIQTAAMLSYEKGLASLKKAVPKASKKKADKSESEDEEEEAPKTKAKGKKAAPAAAAKKGAKSGSPLGGYSASEYKTYKEKLEDAQELSVAGLKALLKKNGMTQTGNKSDLCERVADCQTLGTLPNCTKCGGGRLRYNQKDGSYFCRGYMDDADFVNCSATFSRNEVTRGDWTD